MPLHLRILSSPIFTEAHAEFLKSRSLEWIQDHTATPAENLVEFAGRICYLSFGKERQAPASNAEYIFKLIKSGHESVLEHASWTFLLSGVSRSFTHQLVRHRIGFSFSQLSQQYHEESDADFVVPPGLDSSSFPLWAQTVGELKLVYKKIYDLPTPEGMAPREALRLRRSIARSVLPNATETMIVVTANARAIRHFLDVRGATIGDVEMRIVSQAILENIGEDAPAIFADFETSIAPDGWPLVKRRTVAD